MQIVSWKKLTLKLLDLGGVQNSSPAFAGSPFGFAKQVGIWLLRGSNQDIADCVFLMSRARVLREHIVQVIQGFREPFRSMAAENMLPLDVALESTRDDGRRPPS